MEIFRLMGSIFIDNDKAVKSIDETDKKGKSLSTRFEDMGKKVGAVGGAMTKWVTGPIVAVGGGLLALTTKAGQTADRLLDLSDITGLSSDSIQEWQFVANQAGVSSEAMSSAVEGLVRKLPQLESEGGEATEQLKKLGLTFDDLQNMTPDQMIDTLITRLAEMEDPLERNAVGSQLFGGAWKDLAPILSMGADGIAAAREEAHELGIVIGRDGLEQANKFRQGMDKLKAVFGGLFMEIGTKLAPVLSNELIPIIQDQVVPAIRGIVDKVVSLIEWFSNLDPAWQKIILAAVGLAAALGPVLLVVNQIIIFLPALGAAFTALTGPVGLVIAAIAAAIAIGWLLYENWDEVVAFATDIWGKFADFVVDKWEAVKDFFIGIWNSMIETVENGINQYVKALNFFMKGINAVIDLINKIPGINLGKIEPYAEIELPRLAEGGDVIRGGRAIVGEQGPEILDLPTGAQVRPLSNVAAGNVTININDAFVLDDYGVDKLMDRVMARLRSAGSVNL